jgi:hypothetical protein
MKTIGLSQNLRLPLDWMTLATVVYGARGSGKTTLGRVIAEEVHKARQRFCAIDLKGDWYGLKSTADGAGEGIPVVVFGGDHADLPLEDAAGAGYSPNTGTFNTLLSSLRTLGLIAYPDRGSAVAESVLFP